MARFRRHYHVLEGTPGYLPDTGEVFASMKQASAYAKFLASELRELGYKVRGNQRDGYRAERDKHDLGVVIEITPCAENCEID